MFISTSGEYARRQQLESTLDRIDDALQSRALTRQALSSGQAPPLARFGGAYNEDDEWIEYWRAGMVIGSAPVAPE